MYKRLFLLFSALLCVSCAEAIIGGVGVSSVLFSRHDYKLFSSHKVHSIKKKANKILSSANHSSSSITLVQEDNTVYAVGLVKNDRVKKRIIDVLNAELADNYVDEISIISSDRNYIKDTYLKSRLVKKLLFTKYVKSQNYTILVYNKKAYIIGKASNSFEKDIVINVLTQVQYIDDIVAYITI